MEQKKEHQPQRFNFTTRMLVSSPLPLDNSIQYYPNPQFYFGAGNIVQRDKNALNGKQTNGRQQGAQKGHVGHGRKLLPSQADATLS